MSLEVNAHKNTSPNWYTSRVANPRPLLARHLNYAEEDVISTYYAKICHSNKVMVPFASQWISKFFNITAASLTLQLLLFQRFEVHI